MRLLPIAAALLALLLAIAWFYESAAFNSRAGDDTPLYSARRHDPYGTAALVDLLRERGVSVQTLERPGFDARVRGVLIQVLPKQAQDRFGPRRVPVRTLCDWISSGNVVIQLTRSPTELMQRFKIAPSTRPTAKDDDALEKYELNGKDPIEAPAVVTRARIFGNGARPSSVSDPDDLMLWSPMQFAPEQPAGWSPLAYLPTKDREVVAGELRFGRGKFIVVGAPTPVLNQTLGSDGNLKFVLNQVAAAGAGSVIMDEWSHGIGHEATIMNFLLTVGLVPALIQLAFLALLYLWSTSGQRPPDNFALPRRPSSVEQIETLGFLYSRSFTPDVTFARINAEIQRRLASALRCQPAEIPVRLHKVKPELRQKLEALFDRLARRQPAASIRCVECGYDLFGNKTGRCPECGNSLSAEQRARVAAAPPGRPLRSTTQASRLDSDYADLLSLSHQMAKEVQRDQRTER